MDNVISVANLRFDGQIDPSSNFGAKSVDLAAPGSYILSTVSGNKYSYMSGTSMAAPMVTGAAAMLYSYDSGLAVTEIKGRILNSCLLYTSKNPVNVVKNYGPAYITAVGTMSSAATLAVALECARKSEPTLRDDMVDFGIPLFANIHPVSYTHLGKAFPPG